MNLRLDVARRLAWRRAAWWLAVLVAFALPRDGFGAWEGVDWNGWRRIARWTKPERATRQSGRPELVPLLGSGNGAITNSLGWANERPNLRDAVLEILGAPDALRVPGVEAQVLGEEEQPDHVRRRVRIRSEADDWIPALLLVPRAPGPVRRPAMICLHQTVAQGKEEPTGIRGNPEMAFALELVRRGYVCLAPDAIGFGERIAPGRQPYDDSLAFFRKHPGWSFMGKMVWDTSRLVDYLQALPEVDPERLGCIGHSHGAYGTLFAAAFEPRLKAAVASCGFTTFRSDPNPERWSHLTALMPQLGTYLPDVASIPFDWQHVLALVAPRPLYVWYTTEDRIFPNTGNLDALLRDVRGVYALHDAGERLAWRSAAAPHVFPAPERQAAYAWLDRVLEAPPAKATKTASALFPRALRERARENARRHPWAAEIRDSLVAAARPWRERSDDQLWDLMFGNTLKRAWQVWSDGHCPACRKSVPMYEWQPDALNRPWKLQCPRCREWFPKNDFEAFYRSGLDSRGVFDPARARRELLFNSDHPDPSDPRHGFGVDDGEGYVADGKRWRFINAYLVFGQWKQAILTGIRHLAGAYVATGEPAYAHKAGVLLDRVADLYPTFDFGREGVMYEGPPRAGYVSTWHDACVEVHDLALAYDAVFEGLAEDPTLTAYLREKAARHGLANPKASFADVQRNIEDRILRDTLANRPKIESNYPMTDQTLLVIETVLDWPRNRERMLERLDGIVRVATAVDGLTGEKGIAGYSVIAPRGLAEVMGRFLRSDPGFLREMLRRHPRLHDMYRFHLDTWCLGRFYPRTGDSGGFGSEDTRYAGVVFARNPGLQPSSYSFLWELARATGDVDFARVLVHANDGRTNGLPYDLFAEDPAAMQAGVQSWLAREGPEPRLPSVNKPEWCLAILRSGEGDHRRAAWLDYDSGERHGHADALTLGLFAHGRDLLPDFGYPPVQYGGWSAPRATWYTRSAAHNTVTIDGRDSRPGKGTHTLWFAEGPVQIVRAEAGRLVGARRFERTVALVDVGPESFYVLDVFRVAGGREHVRTFHGPGGGLVTTGVGATVPGTAPIPGVMRDLRWAEASGHPWSATWTLAERPGTRGPVRLRLVDLTRGATAGTAESWVSLHGYGATDEAWIPSVLARRQADAEPLASTFVGVLDAGGPEHALATTRRLDVTTSPDREADDEDVALALGTASGHLDLVWLRGRSRDERLDGPPPSPAEVAFGGITFRTDAEMGWARVGTNGVPQAIVLCRGGFGEVSGLEVRARRPVSVAVELDGTGTPRIRGDVDVIDAASFRGRPLVPRPGDSRGKGLEGRD